MLRRCSRRWPMPDDWPPGRHARPQRPAAADAMATSARIPARRAVPQHADGFARLREPFWKKPSCVKTNPKSVRHIVPRRCTPTWVRSRATSSLRSTAASPSWNAVAPVLPAARAARAGGRDGVKKINFAEPRSRPARHVPPAGPRPKFKFLPPPCGGRPSLAGARYRRVNA